MQPIDRLIGHRLGEIERLAVPALLNADELLVLGDHRVELTGLGSQEAPVVVKPPTVGPMGERTRRALLLLRRQMPLADRRGRVPVLLEHPRERRRVARQHRRITRKPTRRLRDPAHPDRMVVAPRQQRRPCRRAHRRHMEAVIPQALAPRSDRNSGCRSARRTRPDCQTRHRRSAPPTRSEPHPAASHGRSAPNPAENPQGLIRDAAERRTPYRQRRTVNRLVTHLSLRLAVYRSPLGTPGRPRVPSVPSAAPGITAFSQ